MATKTQKQSSAGMGTPTDFSVPKCHSKKKKKIMLSHVNNMQHATTSPKFFVSITIKWIKLGGPISAGHGLSFSGDKGLKFNQILLVTPTTSVLPLLQNILQTGQRLLCPGWNSHFLFCSLQRTYLHQRLELRCETST